MNKEDAQRKRDRALRDLKAANNGLRDMGEIIDGEVIEAEIVDNLPVRHIGSHEDGGPMKRGANAQRMHRP